MAGKRGARGKGPPKSSTKHSLVPDVYQEMLMDALPLQARSSTRPLKQQKTGRSTRKGLGLEDLTKRDVAVPDDSLSPHAKVDSDALTSQSSSSVLPTPPPPPPPPQQTAYEDFDEDSEDSDYDWENVELDVNSASKSASKDLELTLSHSLPPQPKRGRRAVNKADRLIRLGIHKMNILCLLSHLHRRNNWCNDPCVHNSLEPLLSEKLQRFLLPSSSLSQFGRTESLKRGLDEISVLWKTRFSITESGMKRALWSDDTSKLKDFHLPEDVDSVNDLKSFRAAATELKGSRDVGAQLFCALLRSAEVETRLVFSLQILPFKVGGPLRTNIPSVKPRTNSENQRQDCPSTVGTQCLSPGSNQPLISKPYPPVARRLGHPNAADYNLPEISNPQKPMPKIKQKEIKESPYPVFWVEVFDEAHQKWLAVDPLVTQTIARPRRLEPPASDQRNSMTYVIAIDKDGYARDVTRRYVKAYNGKTRKGRVESTSGGDRWWTKTMRSFSRGWYSDADQIELLELANAESMEPMPKNVVDFKDHSYYALERHLRKNEVLVGARECGKVAVGRDPQAAGCRKLENVYRRQDVKVVRSADAWYRLGREIKLGEQPAKVVQTKRLKVDGSDDPADCGRSINLYMEEQTQAYRAPPIVNGRVPKNSYGNIDVFVSTMIPEGGAHLSCRYASQAARILNIDYADALTGFEFRGRHGTAILVGIVVASEYAEAVQAVAEGLEDEEAEIERVARAFAALKMWKRLLIALRIKERIAGYRIEGEDSTVLKHPKTPLLRMDDDNIATTHDDEMQGGFIPDG
ncbi:DNA repair protein [Podosphaera aphanis]|nr:DNA repair protein [Podosphaera aphanis]